MNLRSTRPLRRLAGTALAALTLGACVGEGDDLITEVNVPEAGGELFTRYVALGNSITAGYQSGGITDSLQLRAYPALIAERAGAEFSAPLLLSPGPIRPFVTPLGIQLSPTLGGRLGTSDVRARTNNPRFLNNVAVPGERIGDLLRVSSDPGLSGLHTLMIGPRTQLEVMRDTDPTFVSLWIGNNDALQAGLLGELSLLTPEALFAARVDSVAARIEEAEPMGAMVVGVVNPAVAPLLQPGAFYYLVYAGAVSQGRPSPFGRPVSDNCAPGQPGSRNQVSLAILGTQLPQISCADDAPLVLNTAEAQTVAARVAAFNAALQGAADARGWLYVNPNDILLPFLSDPDRLRKCQGLAALPPNATREQVAAAIQNTCPQLTNPAVGFGSLISFDGVHPSTEAHRILANRFIAAINAKYGRQIPQL